MNNKGVNRTAKATPGLVNMIRQKFFILQQSALLDPFNLSVSQRRKK